MAHAVKSKDVAAHSPAAADTRTRYYDVLETAAKRKSMAILMRKHWVAMMIHRVLAAKQMAKQKKVIMPPLKDAILNYDVTTVKGEYRLVQKPKKLTDIPKLIVPLENTFKVVMKAHLNTNHGGRNDIQQYITNSNHVVSSICASVITRACRKCVMNEDDADTQLQLEDHSPPKALVDIIDMTLQPDKSFDHILVYQDIKTKFVQLRPLTSKTITEDVTMELVKIFADFKRAKSLVTPKALEPIFKEVLVPLNMVFQMEFTLQTCEPDEHMVTVRVMTEIDKWVMNNANEWSVGCYLVQWNMNTDDSDDLWSPFEKFFGLVRFGDFHIPYDNEEGRAGLLDKDTLIYRKKTRSNGKSTKVYNAQRKTTAKETIFTIPDVIDFGEGTSGSNSPQFDNSSVDVSVKMETGKENETVHELGVRNKEVCCTCKEVVDQTERIVCTDCKRCLHLYCGVRLRCAEDKYKHVCFTCVKPNSTKSDTIE